MSSGWADTLFSCHLRISPKGIGPADELSIPPLLLAMTGERRPLLVLFPTLAAAENALSSFRRWMTAAGRSCRVLLLPDGTRELRSASGTDCARAQALHQLLQEPPDILFAAVPAVLNPVPSVREMKKRSFTVRKGMTLSLMELARQLTELDYDDELEVTVPGEFSKRGGLLDVFSPSGRQPARIEFFGDEIESIRLFSPESQRSTGEVEEYEIILRSGSGSELLEQGEIQDYFKGWDPLLVPVFPETLRVQVERFSPDALTRWESFPVAFGKNVCPLYDEPGTALHPEAQTPPFFAMHGQLMKALPKGGEKAFSDLGRQWMQSTAHRLVTKEKYQCVLCCRSAADEGHFRQWLNEAKLDTASTVSVEENNLPGGLFAPKQKIILLTEQEIFVSPVRSRSGGTDEDAEEAVGAADSAADLNEGDHAVHLDHGVCIFRGLELVTSGGSKAEMITLEFADETILHVPLWQAHLLTRYVGAGKKGVNLSSIHTSRWGKTRAAAALSVRNLAYDMLRMQAMRNSIQADSFPPDTLDQRLFEQAFPFRETADQIRSAGEIKRDMESAKPMDRLLCGDVGYGKTELAMRAAFKCVMAGKQVAVLVPTTVLAQQHYYSFMERFAGFPVMIEQLSRFRTKGEQAKIIQRMKEGTLDIVIGTHRLVQDDISFKNLGLIIIDEEQRFGVLHKERLKRLRAETDVLTMTATPIPRTLYLSMAGMRDMSTILTAPVRRLPVQTVIVPDDPAVVRNAIARELERGGQVYYLFNRVKGIDEAAGKLKEMFPRARIGIGHGQMPEEQLENVMSDFIENKLDILVCTTIIESGLDIPNANTIVIDRADRFGLAELYQLRGRVGRWTRQAYAYLLLPRSGILTGDARERIAAMRRYTHLGAGFKLAMSDLQLRGAGSILGSEQSGQINAIGFHLYCELLRDCIANLNQQEKELRVVRKSADLRLDFLEFAYAPSKNKLGAGFPPDYIESPAMRFRVCRKLSLCANEQEVEQYREELRDRFGTLPASAEHYISVVKLRLLGAEKKIDTISVYGGKAILERGHSILKPGGIVPRIPDELTPEEKLSRLFAVINALPGE